MNHDMAAAARRTVLHGGSVGTTVELLDIPGQGQVVAKSAIGSGILGNGRQKLLYEAWFLRCLDTRARELFVELLDVQTSRDRVTLLMSFCCGGYTLEDMLSEPSRGEDCATVVETVLKGLHEHLHAPTATEATAATEEWLSSYMNNRIDARLTQLDAAPFRNGIEDWPSRCASLKESVLATKATQTFGAVARSTRLCLTHGDASPPNTLVDAKDGTRFKLIDPSQSPIRGCRLSDPAEDVFRLLTYVDSVADGVPIRPPCSSVVRLPSAIGDTTPEGRQDSWRATKALLRHRMNVPRLLSDFYPYAELLEARRLLIEAALLFGVAARRILEGHSRLGVALWDRSSLSLQKFLRDFA